jgi:YidC/Oxa1 family membrane protein insertase
MPQMAIIDGVRKNASLFSSVMSPEEIDKVLNLNMSFLGIHLGEIPYLGFNVLMLIPILSGLTSFMVSMQSMKNTGETSADASANSMKTMMYIMPLMSVMFCFSLPAGVGMYWIASNVFSYLQGLIMNKKYNPTEMAEKIKAEQASQAAKERMEKIENRRKAREELMAHQAEVEAAKKANAKGKKKKVEMPEELDEETVQQALSVKEQNRRKLAEARKRDAEKYGEEYVEVTDDDLK